MQQQTEVQVCGTPHLGMNPFNGTTTVRVRYHSTDPESTIHAVVCILLDPAGGRIRMWPEWYGEI